MKCQASFDIKVIVEELKEFIGSRIDKFYNTKKGELLIRFYNKKKGKRVLRIHKGCCLHLTKHKYLVPREPSGFTMLMRKYMKSAVVTNISQPGFERIIIISVKTKDKSYNLFFELFDKGNVVVCTSNNKIINALRFTERRSIKPGTSYELPEPRFKPEYIDKLEFRRVIKGSDKDMLVKALASDMGLGGKYAEELIELSNIDKETNPGYMSKEDIKKLYKTFLIMYKSVKHYMHINPVVVETEEGELIDFCPFKFKSYKKYNFKNFSSFNAACDYYYSLKKKHEKIRKRREKYLRKVNKLKKRKEEQHERLNHLIKKSKYLQNVGNIIYNNYEFLNSILRKILEANKSGISWNRIKDMIKREKDKESPEALSIKKINEKNNSIIIQLGGEVFDLPISGDLNDAAQEYFNQSKKLKRKIIGAEESMRNTQERLQKVKEEKMIEPERIIEKIKREKKWYEKFKWMITSNKFLLICGKDREQNEILIKKYKESNDLVFHAVIKGSPFGILKNGQDAEYKDLKESAHFVACFSKAWSEKMPVDTYYTKPENVSKRAPSGEYVPYGSFTIKGDVKYFKNIIPKLSIGYTKKLKIIGGSEELIKKKCLEYVNIKPGRIKTGKIAERIKKILGRHESRIKKLKSEEFLKFIPGPSRLEI